MGRGLGTRLLKMLKIEFLAKNLMETVSDILWRGSCPARKSVPWSMTQGQKPYFFVVSKRG